MDLSAPEPKPKPEALSVSRFVHRAFSKLRRTLFLRIVDEIYVADLRLFLSSPTEYPTAPNGLSIRLLSNADLKYVSTSLGTSYANDFRIRLTNSLGMAAFSGEKLAGYTWITTENRKNEGEPPLLYDISLPPLTAYLFDTYVLDSYRRQGLAFLLTKQILGEAARLGATQCVTMHDQTNSGIIEISKRLGFQKQGFVTYTRLGPWSRKDLRALNMLPVSRHV